MFNMKAREIRVGNDEVQRQTYCSDVQPLLQSLLSTLADLDFEYERERERISGSTADPSLKVRLLRKLEENHRERRDPYIRHLTILQARVMPSERR